MRGCIKKLVYGLLINVSCIMKRQVHKLDTSYNVSTSGGARSTLASKLSIYATKLL